MVVYLHHKVNFNYKRLYMKSLLLVLFVGILHSISFSQTQHPKFQECLKNSPNVMTTFCVKDDVGLVDFLLKENVKIKYRSSSWLFITVTPAWMDQNQKNGNIKQFYYESAPAQLMSDTTRLKRFVDPVHQGLGGLSQPYTGANVIMGLVDTGIDFSHPDFKSANGDTRVLRIWDQADVSGINTYGLYGYGRLWDSTAINNGTCTHITTDKHGTQVSGVAAGNGLANGKNKGMAPDSKIVMVATNLNATNWTLTVADACDYIFKFADSLGLPAVINVSAGNYFGSHDGNDPASVIIEQFLSEKGGRVMVTAAGNGGSLTLGKFHLSGNVTSDTTFTWFKNNASNIVYFDLWADTADANFDFAFGADKPAPNYGLRATTMFRNARANLNTTVLDTLWNGTNRIATMQIWTELIDSAYHLEFFMDHVDSTTYKYRFLTKGAGKYDLWSGAWLGANDIETVIPSSTILPQIVNYQMPDTLQTMVSSFQCSESVITVANSKNRWSYINLNGVVVNTNATVPVESISNTSSRGPNRLRQQKPDITCNGDATFSPTTSWYLANAANANNILQGGWHSKMTGTSIASPAVAGIAALYLEKCPTATYSDFKRDLIETATTDNYTGIVPNISYGYGKPHALNLLLGANNVPIVGGPGICLDPVNLTTNTYTSIDSVVWNTGANATSITTSTPADYFADVYYGNGCVAHTDTITLVQNIVPANPVISNVSTLFTSDVQTNYQWTLNGVNIAGATSQSYTAVPPFGIYAVSTTAVGGCMSVSNSIDLTAGITEIEILNGLISPNPTTSDFSISINDAIISISATDINGKEVNLIEKGNHVYSLSGLKTGTYYLLVVTEKGLFRSKIIKM